MVTMKDVAQLAGVSITTVSHVVNGTRAVAAETKERVLDAVARTGYTGDVTVNLRLGNATGFGGGITGIRNVTGSIGNDMLVGDDLANVLIGGSGRNIVIGGGGPTGLMLAGELALAGVDVAIVERRANQDLASSRAGGLHSRAIAVLDQRGQAKRRVHGTGGRASRLRGTGGHRWTACRRRAGRAR